ncbi:MAG: gamma-glutamyl-gamma-aminobutyrate hydrolase family protein, partial [Verrucomicrobiota bacterium]
MKPVTRRWTLSLAGAALAGILGFEIGQRTAPERIDSTGAPLIGIASLSTDLYVRAVRESGGVPVVLPNTDGSIEKVDEYLDLLDGLLLPGGADIPPGEYGEERHETVEVLDDERYQFEKNLGSAWIEKTDKPLLGICLGGQWINVLYGGTLIQDIPSEIGTNHRLTVHEIAVESGSRLHQILGESDLEVNSRHHQAVDDLGKSLRIVARSPDGVVEAIETTDP